MGAKKDKEGNDYLPDMAECLGNMIFHRFDGYAQLAGDLFIGTALECFEHDDLLANGREGLDGGADLIGDLEMAGGRRLVDFLFF